MTTIQPNVTGRKAAQATSPLPAAVDIDDLVDDKEAARALHQKPQTLAGWRCEGKGPVYLKIGRRVFYRRSDLSAWLATQIVHPGAAA